MNMDFKKTLFPLKRQTIVTIIIGVAVIGSALLLENRKPINATDMQSLEVMSRLTALQMQLTQVEHAVNKPLKEVNLDAITQQISLLTTRLGQLRAVNPDELHHTETTLQGQLKSIEATINHLDTKSTPIHYLKPENLPFKVVSLDSIQHIPVASVAYDFKTIPLEKNDMLAGWTLISLDYGKQRLAFENSKKERVLITHEFIG